MHSVNRCGEAGASALQLRDIKQHPEEFAEIITNTIFCFFSFLL